MSTRPLIADNFAGGGGASEGIRLALGRDVDIAINHDRQALAMHHANHPDSTHLCEDVFRVDILAACGGRRPALAWFSPDCKHFSKAKGGKPRSKKIRALAGVMVKWGAAVKPWVMVLENVEEFVTWGPLLANGKPCPRRKGTTFRHFVGQLRALGYVVEWRELRACDHDTPTIRKRLFLVARCDGRPIVWPEQTNGSPDSEGVKSGRLAKWRTAAECIDFSLPCPSIFGRKKPLAEATLRRIARGLRKFVIEAAEPFVIPLTHHGDERVHGMGFPLPTVTAAHRGELALVAPVLTEHANASGQRIFSAKEPLRTQCGEVKGGHFALISPTLVVKKSSEKWRQTCNCGHRYIARLDEVCPKCHTIQGGYTHGDPINPVLCAPTLVQTGYGERAGQSPRAPGLGKPLGTAVAGGVKAALVSAFLAKHYGGHETPGWPLGKPASTVTSVDHHGLVTAHVAKLRGSNTGHGMREPAHTISAQGTHLAEVRAFLVKYYGTAKSGAKLREPMHSITTKDRLGLVTIHGTEYVITDIGLRMLTPRELFRAQGFPDSYIIGDRPGDTLKLTKSEQVRMCGNSVCPPLAAAVVRANCPHLIEHRKERAA